MAGADGRPSDIGGGSERQRPAGRVWRQQELQLPPRARRGGRAQHGQQELEAGRTVTVAEARGSGWRSAPGKRVAATG